MKSVLEGFAFDLPKKETPVIPHKTENRIKLLVDKAGLIADDSNTEYGDAFAVLVVHFRDRDIESALEPPDNALDDTPFSLE